MIDRYMDHRNSQLLPMPKPNEDLLNDNQPDILLEHFIETVTEISNFPGVSPLMSSEEELKCRKTKVVLRYHVPNRNIYHEKYEHHILFIFYPFRTEIEFLLIIHT